MKLYSSGWIVSQPHHTENQHFSTKAFHVCIDLVIIRKVLGVFFPFRLCIQFSSQFGNNLKIIQIHDKSHLHQRVLYVGFNVMDETGESSPSSLTLTE